MKTIKITLDEKLRALGITRYELAKRSEIGYQTIDNYYKGPVEKYPPLVLKSWYNQKNHGESRE